MFFSCRCQFFCSLAIFYVYLYICSRLYRSAGGCIIVSVSLRLFVHACQERLQNGTMSDCCVNSSVLSSLTVLKACINHRRRSSINFGEHDIFARKMSEKLTKCPNFTNFARKLPEFYIIIARKIFSRICPPPSPTPMLL